MTEGATPTMDAAPQAEPLATSPESAKNPLIGSKHKVVIDGQELEVDYNDLISDYQHKRASHKRFEEAHKIRKDVDTLFESFKKGDLGFLKQHIPPDVLRQFAERELQEYLEEQALSPEQKEVRQTKAERDALKKQLDEKNELEKKSYSQQIQQQADQQIDNEITEAVKSLGHDVKVTPRLIRRIAEQMLISSEASDDPKTEHLPAKIAGERAKKGMRKDFEEYASIADPEEVVAMLPRRVRDAIRKADVDSAISQMPRSVRNSNQPSDDSEAKTSHATKFRRGSTDDWFNRMENTLQKRG